MSSTESRRPIKRSAVSDQQKRRDLALLRQEQNRQKAQEHARSLASSAISLPPGSPDMEVDLTQEVGSPSQELSMVEASKLGGREARKLFAQQFMLPEWMIDIPSQLSADW